MAGNRLSTISQIVDSGNVEAIFLIERDDGAKRKHYIVFDPATDISALMSAAAANFAADGDPAFETDAEGRVKAFAAVARTPEVIAAADAALDAGLYAKRAELDAVQAEIDQRVADANAQLAAIVEQINAALAAAPKT